MKERREKEREQMGISNKFILNTLYIYKTLKNNTTQTHLKLYDLLLFAKL